MLHDPILLYFSTAVILQRCPDYLLAEIPNTANSCSRHGMAIVKLTSQRPQIFIPVSKIFTLLVIHSQL